MGHQKTAALLMIDFQRDFCAPGGYSHHLLYNSNTNGFRPKTFAALVDGILEAVARAHVDLAPSALTLSHGIYGMLGAFMPSGVLPHHAPRPRRCRTSASDAFASIPWYAARRRSLTLPTS